MSSKCSAAQLLTVLVASSGDMMNRDKFSGSVLVEELDVLNQNPLEKVSSDFTCHLLADSAQQENVDESES
jgi:hypothetical protein